MDADPTENLALHQSDKRTSKILTHFFSIGVTTYNRRELLKQTLDSIITQTFADFEVIVGNDYTQETLSAELLGIQDPRIRFVNYPQNLGSLPNMNMLLDMSRGRYFTWLADDDLFVPDFLQSVHAALVRFEFPLCAFTGFQSAATCQAQHQTVVSEPQLLTGRDFLHRYLDRSIKTQGCYGAFSRQYISRLGGMQTLGNGFSPYSDNLLAIRAGLLDRVVYIDAPLVFFRAHPGSMSHSSGDLDAYSSAQDDLCRISVSLFESERLQADFSSNLFLLLKWCAEDYILAARRSVMLETKQAVAYIRLLKKYVDLLRGSSAQARGIKLLIETTYFLARNLCRVQIYRLIGMPKGTTV